MHQWKPRDMETLVEGTHWFLKSLTPPVCQRYIEHLYTVMPKVVQVEGGYSLVFEESDSTSMPALH